MVVLIINPARDLHNLFFRAFMLTSSLKHKVYQILNKRREGQSRMNNPETLATLDTHIKILYNSLAYTGLGIVRIY
jgi:hypothetical protein